MVLQNCRLERLAFSKALNIQTYQISSRRKWSRYNTEVFSYYDGVTITMKFTKTFAPIQEVYKPLIWKELATYENLKKKLTMNLIPKLCDSLSTHSHRYRGQKNVSENWNLHDNMSEINKGEEHEQIITRIIPESCTPPGVMWKFHSECWLLIHSYVLFCVYHLSIVILKITFIVCQKANW